MVFFFSSFCFRLPFQKYIDFWASTYFGLRKVELSLELSFIDSFRKFFRGFCPELKL